MLFGSESRLKLGVDIHSHLIPGVDDGVRTLAQSVEIIRSFQSLGYKKLITTPHISEYYPNTADTLREGLKSVKAELKNIQLDIEIELGAEYMVDGKFLNMVKEQADLLSWHGYILIETPFTTSPFIFDEVIFELQTRGLHPVLAHPERYEYFFGNVEAIRRIRDKGVRMQVSASSFAGYYGPEQKKMARQILRESLIDFIGSDMHMFGQMEFLKRGLKSRYLRKMDASKLLNHSLIN